MIQNFHTIFSIAGNIGFDILSTKIHFIRAKLPNKKLYIDGYFQGKIFGKFLAVTSKAVQKLKAFWLSKVLQ